MPRGRPGRHPRTMRRCGSRRCSPSRTPPARSATASPIPPPRRGLDRARRASPMSSSCATPRRHPRPPRSRSRGVRASCPTRAPDHGYAGHAEPRAVDPGAAERPAFDPALCDARGVEWVLLVVGLLALAFGAFLAARARIAQRDVAAAIGASGPDDTVAAARATRERADRLAADTAAAEADRDAFLDSLQIGVLGVQPGFRIVAANPAAHTLLGREPRTLIGRSVIEAFLDTEVEATARAAIENGSATGEYAPSGPDGPRLVVRARRSPAGDLWLLLEDVSELRRLRQIRAEFIDNLSHELRTPLTTVSLLAETLTREADAAGDAIPPRMRDRILKIEVETGHLVQMVSELLDLSRIESGGGLGEVDVLDLGRVAAESTERLRLFADRQGVTLRVEVADDLPPVRGDAARLGQVVVNLVHNAVKFSPDGGDVTVSVRAARGDGQVIVAIEDHGVGIPRKAQPRIFERFYKVDRARVRGEAGGTGLGLAIARHIVEQHGGRIWVESREGRGSTFSFALPVVTDAPASPGGPGAPVAASPSTH